MTNQPQNNKPKDWSYEIGSVASGKFLSVANKDGVLKVESNIKGGLGCLLLTLSAPALLILGVASCVSSAPADEPAPEAVPVHPEDYPRLQSPVAHRP